ncbi:unnamed protein product [Periconia digitata]|uniref:Uncharacterized protein n=1 Tax=Periconia digitata TaxID=1303443 RepID=A0A9W4XQF6_9PLEO|nr:unnamed protein product [Periconia digitata]
MASTAPFPLKDVLCVARIHPFYTRATKYPPSDDKILAAQKHADEIAPDLEAHQLTWKSDLYKSIRRLVHDTSPENHFRRRSYISNTGGGSGSSPLFFTTDVHENRHARSLFGSLIRRAGLIGDTDFVVTTHASGKLYRSLDLMTEIFESAGASVLTAGHILAPKDVVELIIKYHANVLSGDASQIVSVVYYVATLPKERSVGLHLDKIIYTSSGLTPFQRSEILLVFPKVQIYSILGSAEAGPYAFSCSHLLSSNWANLSHEDFIYVTRQMRIEILPASTTEQEATPEPLCDGEKGIIAQTSLMRLRNPLVRYVTGDVGSLHHVAGNVRKAIPCLNETHFRVLRLQGRDHRFSFEWDGEYFEFSNVSDLMNDPKSGVLQWQVLLDKMEGSEEEFLEVRVVRALSADQNGTNIHSREKLTRTIEIFFHIYKHNRHRFNLAFMDNDNAFQRSGTGRKIIKFINNFN